MIDLNSISDEKLAAYIDGNLPIDEMSLISEAVNTEFSLSEVVDIVSGADYTLDDPSQFGDDLSNYTDNWAEMIDNCDTLTPDNFDIWGIFNDDIISHQHNDDNLWHSQSSIEPESSISSDIFDNPNPAVDL